MKKREIELLDLQNLTTIIYIGSLLISIYITSIDKNRIIDKNKNYKDTSNLSKFNRILVVILTLSYLYINYENRKIVKKKKGNISLSNLQIMASEISLVSTIIVTYVVFKSLGDNYTVISGIENPNL